MKKTKKILIGAMLSLGLFSCSNNDDNSSKVVAEEHSFEFNAQTDASSPTGKNAATSYTLTVEAVGKDGKVLDTKTFTGTASGQINDKLTTTTGDVEIHVKVLPATIPIKNISILPKNEKTKEPGKAIVIAALPATGEVKVNYDTIQKEIKVITQGIESFIPSDGFLDRLSAVSVETTVGTAAPVKRYKTFAYDSKGNLVSSVYVNAGVTEKSEYVYEAGRLIKINKTVGAKTTTEVLTYTGDNITLLKNELGGYQSSYVYDGAKIVTATDTGTNAVTSTLSYNAQNPLRMTYKTNAMNQSLVYILNTNVDPFATSIPAAYLKLLSYKGEDKTNIESEQVDGTTALTATYTYEKDSKGRIVKKTRVTKDGTVVTSTSVTTYQYLSK
ncbi:hypothetical protein [Flavobacterium daemonense]|uniref:hypothetical protein n=1 Tax=Flavobacterium daemonense TaxID=1393049 RepID=UPI001184C7F2|nr:hypothetical protein [Flavobacterium daemonense]KAF2333089.1 hypothetical protein FND99_10650 [Flavobacterium daemonense]